MKTKFGFGFWVLGKNNFFYNLKEKATILHIFPYNEKHFKNLTMRFLYSMVYPSKF